MVSLEDKILGYRGENYCSSSESEEEPEVDLGERAGQTLCDHSSPSLPTHSAFGNTSSANTGPKGVIEDWRLFRKMKNAETAEAEEKLIQLAKGRSMFCATEEDENGIDEITEIFSNDDDLRQFALKRMEELQIKYAQGSDSHYGTVREVSSKEEMLEIIEDDSTKTTVFVHIYEKDIPGCPAMDESFRDLAAWYPQFNFCRSRASTMGMSLHFRRHGLPTLQVYKNKELVLNVVRLTDHLGDDFDADDLEQLLREYAVITESLSPTQR
uniref:Phosducin thioredoxin-like domain-containing protein n=1 Tax=Trichuris muris TaxID=70415 RepID=A0A5S6QVW9_TRIMR